MTKLQYRACHRVPLEGHYTGFFFIYVPILTHESALKSQVNGKALLPTLLKTIDSKTLTIFLFHWHLTLLPVLHSKEVARNTVTVLK